MDLAVNPNTVARAYLDLEHEGVIYKRAGQGTFVSRQGVEMSKRERLKLFHDFLERALVEGVHLGLEPMEMKNSFDQQLERIVLSRQGQKERGR
jgi:GntR family transcriptional regulator